MKSQEIGKMLNSFEATLDLQLPFKTREFQLLMESAENTMFDGKNNISELIGRKSARLQVKTEDVEDLGNVLEELSDSSPIRNLRLDPTSIFKSCLKRAPDSCSQDNESRSSSSGITSFEDKNPPKGASGLSNLVNFDDHFTLENQAPKSVCLKPNFGRARSNRSNRNISTIDSSMQHS